MPFHSLHIIMVNIVGLFPTKTFLLLRRSSKLLQKELNMLCVVCNFEIDKDRKKNILA